jgi:hypothetical protein
MLHQVAPHTRALGAYLDTERGEIVAWADTASQQ